jgi:hypothetical protein
MKTQGIQKLSETVVVMSLFFALTMGQAYGWGSATHAYIDDHLGKKGPVKNLNEIYGAMVPDVFNFLFSNMDMMKYLYTVTHYQGVGYADDYLNVWENSHNFLSKATAFGFVSHNGNFGADLTAHHHSLFFNENHGYVIIKAAELNGFLNLAQYGFPQEVVDELCHDLIEFALDIMITQKNKGLAAKISKAAMLRTPEFPLILVKSYADGLVEQNFPGIDHPAAIKLILKTENEFRKSMISYGQALMQDQDTATNLIAQHLVDLAKVFLGELPAPDSVFLELAKTGLSLSMQICSPDFYIELDRTINFVSGQLAENDISY